MSDLAPLVPDPLLPGGSVAVRLVNLPDEAMTALLEGDRARASGALTDDGEPRPLVQLRLAAEHAVLLDCLLDTGSMGWHE